MLPAAILSPQGGLHSGDRLQYSSVCPKTSQQDTEMQGSSRLRLPLAIRHPPHLRRHFRGLVLILKACRLVVGINGMYKVVLRQHPSGSTQRCRMVGRPCGQFQGDCNVERLSTTLRMVAMDRCFPIMMDDRQAREAIIARTLSTACETS